MSRPNDERAGDCGAHPPKNHQNQSLHFAHDDGDSKALATMKARAALCGRTLIEMADGEFLVAKWNYSRAVPCLRAVGDLLRRIGGRP
jgi:hypothetical protein